MMHRESIKKVLREASILNCTFEGGYPKTVLGNSDGIAIGVKSYSLPTEAIHQSEKLTVPTADIQKLTPLPGMKKENRGTCTFSNWPQHG